MNKINNIKFIVLIFSFILLVSSCKKEEDVYNDAKSIKSETISAETIENILSVRNSKLTNANGEEGMDYDSQTGDIRISVSSSEGADYTFANSLILAVDMDTSAILRKITSIDTTGNVIHLQTEDVEFEKVFRNADFELDSKMNANVKLKSTASDENICAALTDGHTIHPARVIYHTDKGVYAESVFSGETIEGIKMVDSNLKKTINLDLVDLDFSGYSIFNYSNEVNGIKENMSLTVGKGNVYMGTGFTMNVNISWFKLKQCEFYVSPNASTDITLDFEASVSKAIEGQVKLTDITYVTYVYYIGCIPFSVSLDFDLYAEYSLSAEGKVNAEASFSADLDSKFGAKYVSGEGWSGIKSFTHTFNSSLSYEAEVNAHAKASVYPQCCAKIYGINGITLGIKPYVYADFIAGVNNTSPYYSYELGAGLTADVIAQVKIFSWTLAKYDKEFNIISPYVIASGSSDN